MSVEEMVDEIVRYYQLTDMLIEKAGEQWHVSAVCKHGVIAVSNKGFYDAISDFHNRLITEEMYAG